jgi:hypothetical protein
MTENTDPTAEQTTEPSRTRQIVAFTAVTVVTVAIGLAASKVSQMVGKKVHETIIPPQTEDTDE